MSLKRGEQKHEIEERLLNKIMISYYLITLLKDDIITVKIDGVNIVTYCKIMQTQSNMSTFDNNNFEVW